MSKPSYNILITTFDACGHINAICGFGELLASHGHKITFAQRSKYKKLADQRGFQFIPLEEEANDSNFENVINDWIDNNMVKFRLDPMFRFKNYTEQDKVNAALGVQLFRKLDQLLSAVIQSADPPFDAIVHDGLDVLDCLYKTKIPVIASFSAAPLLLYKNGPPGASGLSVHSDRSLWDEFRRDCSDAFSELAKNFDILLKESGRDEIFNPTRWVLPLKTIGFYHYPAEIDFADDCGLVDPGWHRIDCYVRSPDEDTFVLPEKLKDKPGKLIYFSLGSTASRDLLIMQKALSALARSPNQFIVSMGSRGDQLQLADNMWGDGYVNQIKVLQMVDMVITHGGNNTFMESLYFGKPMIVIPYLVDQLDNAQRVVDKKLDFRMNPWEFDEDRLLEYIEAILNDTDLQERVQKISHNMRNSDSSRRAVELIEKLIENVGQV